MRNTKKGVAFVLLGATLWATLPAFSRFVYSAGSEPLTAAAMRAYLASIVFIIWFLADGTFKKIKMEEIPFYFIYGLTGVGGTFLFYMTAVKMISTAMAAVLLYTAPAFVIILSRIFYKNPITPAKLAALMCTFGGCALVVRLYDFSSFTANISGIVVGLAAGLSYSMVTVIGQTAQTKHDPRTNTGLMIIFGSILFLVIKPPWAIPAPTPHLWLGYIGLAMFGSVFAYLSYLKGFNLIGDGGISSITASLEPVMATLFCAVIYGDSIQTLQLLGIAIVLLGISLPILHQKHLEKLEKELEQTETDASD